MKQLVVNKSVVPLSKPMFTMDMEEAAIQALRNEHFVLGESVFKFEEEFARYCGVKHAVSVSSGTIALQLTLQALGFKRPENVVLTTPMSFVATANAVLHANATPAFTDITAEDALLDPRRIGSSLREISAVIPVHLYGKPAAVDDILSVVGDDVPLVEDACQAHGAIYRGRRVGALGVAGCFSFYSTKNMTVGGDGGMITTNDNRLAQKTRKLRDCGRISHYLHDEIGYSARLNTVNAAIGRVQLRYLDKWNARRRELASRYSTALANLEKLSLPPQSSDSEPVYHLYVVRTRHRDDLQSYLAVKGITTGIHYPVPIHLQPVYRETFGYKPGNFQNAERHAKTALSLPMYPELKEEEVDYVVEQIQSFFLETHTK